MPRITILYAALMILLGVGGYFGSGRASATALIPSFIGVAILACGLLALKGKFVMHVMHGALLLALIAVIGGFKRGPLMIGAALDGTAERPLAVWVTTIMVALSIGFIVLGIRSFVQVRKARARTAEGGDDKVTR